MIEYFGWPNRNRGFTLAELLLTFTICGILISLATPDFRSLISRNQIMVQGNNLVASLQTARYTAIVQREIVHICQIRDSQTHRCSNDYSRNRNWSAGWMSFIDVNRNNEYDDNDEIIKVIQGTDQIKVVFNQQGRLRYFPDGSARSAGFTLCDSQRQYYRHVYLLYTGRARMKSEVSAKQRAKCDSVEALGQGGE